MAPRNTTLPEGSTPEEADTAAQELAARRQQELAAAREEGAREERERAAEVQRVSQEQALRTADVDAERQADAQALAEAEAREAARNRMDRTGHRLEVRGPAGGRWRAGRHFTVVPTIIEPGVLTRAERQMIDSDPVLAVRSTETD